MSEKLHREMVELLDVIHPVSSSTAVTSAWVDVNGYREIVWELLVGLIAATGTLNMTVQQGNTAAGGAPKDITELDGIGVFAITALAAADDDLAINVTMLTEFMDRDGGFRWIQVTVTPAVAASLIALTVKGSRQRQEPVSTAIYEEVVGP